MTPTYRNRNLLEAAFSFWTLVYHSIVRRVRTKSGNATLGLLVEVSQSLLMVGMFLLIFEFMGLRALAIRGNSVLFIITGVFLFLTHNTAISSVMGASNNTTPIMKHAPMTTMIAILSTALAGLYLQLLAFAIIYFIVHIFVGGMDIQDPVGLILPFFLSWASGCTIGLLFMCIRPLAPKFVTMVAMVYRRANMITSGKMVAANTMGAAMIKWFDWNPLFHTIDQARGAAFVNYTPRNSSMEYAIYFTLVTLVIGLMGERWLRNNISLSWNAR